MSEVRYARAARHVTLNRPRPHCHPQSRQFINFALKWLTEPQRLLLRQRFWEGLSIEQIAAQAGVAAGEVRKAEAAALLTCRSLIRPLIDEATRCA